MFRSILEGDFKESGLRGAAGPFVSIPYEAYSAKLAIKELSFDGRLTEWQTFQQKHRENHLSQLFVGLGWAVANTGVSIDGLAHSLTKYELERVADGIGYYHGLFKKRESIRQQLIPENILSHKLTCSYLQGLGRSLFYSSCGNPDRCQQAIQLFPVNLQADLWRGVGVATGYVGGISLQGANDFLLTSGPYSNNFKCGLLLAFDGKTKAGDNSTDLSKLLNHFGLTPLLIEDGLTPLLSNIRQIELSLSKTP